MAVVTTPYKNAPEFVGEIQGEYILVIQKGNNTGATGRAEMMRITLAQLQAFINKGFGSAWRFRGAVSALPNDPITNDYFLAASAFISGGKTYQINHLYGYNGSTWSDISGLLEQYATVEALAELDDKVDALIGSGISFKGQITYAELMQIAPSSSNIGWEYYVTDKNSMYVSDGTVWIQITKIAQTTGQSEIELMSQKAITDAISDEESARTSADSDLQAQLVNVNAELDNVEALIGGDAQIENTDPTEGESLLAQSRLIHHANLLPNGEFGRVGARGTQFNQLVQNGNFNSDTYWRNNAPSYSTITVANGQSKQVFSSTPPNWYDSGIVQINHAYSIIQGHYYLFVYDVKCTKNIGAIGYVENIGTFSPKTVSPNVWTQYGAIRQATTTGTVYNFLVYNNNSTILANGDTIEIKNVMLFDLTEMGEYDSTLTDAQNIARFRSKFPASYYPNDTGHIYDLNPTGFRIRGVNLFSEEMVLGSINSSGSEISATNAMRSSNYDSCSGNKAYYFLKPTGVYFAIYWYDAGKHFISAVGYRSGSAGVETSPSTACYFRLVCGDSQIAYTSYNHDIQIADNSLPTSVKTTYHASEHHVVDTPQISDGHYVNENCYDYVENVVEDGVLKGKKHTVVIVKDLSTLNWSGTYSTTDLASLIKIPASNVKANMVFSNPAYTVKSVGSDSGVAGSGDAFINTSGNLIIRASSTPTGYIYIEAKEEVITDCEPLRSFGISDYSTIEPITPQTELVNRIDVPFSVKTISANTLIEQIKTNTEDITVLKNALEDSEQRIENLEQAVSGSLVQTNTDATQKNTKSITSANTILPWALLNRVGARAVPWNQLANVAATVFGTRVNSYTFNANFSARNQTYQQTTETIKTVSGHKYLLRIKSDGSPNLRTAVNGIIPFIGELTISQGYETILTGDGSDSYFNFTQSDVSLGGNGNIYINFFDLSAMSEYDSTKTDAQNIANFKAKFPASYYPNNNGQIIPLNPSGFKVVGWNKFDKSSALADRTLDSNGGIQISSDWSVSELIGVLPNSEYYFKDIASSYYRIAIAWYDGNGTFIKTNSVGVDTPYNVSGSVTSPSNAYYLRVTIRTDYVDTCCINISQTDSTKPLHNGVYKAYFETTIDTSFTSDYNYVNESCHDYSENVLVDGQKMREEHRIVVSVDAGTLDWTYSPDYQVFLSSGISDMKPIAEGVSTYYIMCAKYVTSPFSSASNSPDMTIYPRTVNSVTGVGVKDSNYTSASAFKTSMNGVIIYYELATPSVTLHNDPIPNFPCEDGTTITAITPQTDLVNAIDVPNTIAYMTKIAS